MSALHPLHRAWQTLPAAPRRWAFVQATSLLAPRPARDPLPPRGGLIIGGELDRASGLGEGARLMAAAARSLGVAVWTADDAGLKANSADLPDAAPLVLHVNAPMLPAALLALPRRLLGRRRVIGYWAWELPVVPASWQAGIRFVHEVWVPSRFTAAALENLMPARIRVVPHPVAASRPSPSALGRRDFGLPDNAFIVLTSFSLASSFVRKNPLAAVAAFRLAFGAAPDRILLLKVSHSENWPGDLAELRAAVADLPNVRVETRLLPAADSHALTSCVDVVLSLHRSEGFGLVPAEAMLLGRPVVATDWSGTTDFLDASCGVPVRFRLVPAVDPRGVFEAPGAMWAEADVADAAAALADLAANPDRRRALGEAARQAAAVRLGADGLRQALRDIGLVSGG